MTSATICAKVLVVNRLHKSAPSVVPNRPVKSFLTLGFISTRKDKVYLRHENKIEGNKYQSSYQVNKVNVENIYDKFIKEGKLTIQFRKPTTDLLIEGNYIKVKKFQHLLKQVISSESPEKLNLPYLNDKLRLVAEDENKSLVVKRKDKIPNFSRNLQYLEINECSLKKFDIRIVRLQHLKTLNLSNNDLEDIPDQIDLLPCLQELILENNKIGQKRTFSWLNSETVRLHLEVLDLKKNELTFLPREIVHLKKIRNLHLDHNQIKAFPPRIGNLQTLQVFTFSNNQLTYLPGSFMTLRMNSIDFSDNNFVIDVGLTENAKRKFPSLLEQTAIKVLQERIEYNEETLPRTVINYLEGSGHCICGVPVFGGYQFTTNYHLSLLLITAKHYVSSIGCQVPTIRFNLCSLLCPKKTYYFGQR